MQNAATIHTSWNGKVWHLTAMVNLVQILGLNQGLLAKHELQLRAQSYHDISMEEVQARRQHRQVYNRPLHDYVPLFFKQRNPMMYYLKSEAANLVWLEIDTSLLYRDSLVTADGNAACTDTSFESGLSPALVDWQVMDARSWHDIPGGKRKRAAELLCLSQVPASAIVALHVQGSKQKLDLLGYGLPVLVNPFAFFS